MRAGSVHRVNIQIGTDTPYQRISTFRLDLPLIKFLSSISILEIACHLFEACPEHFCVAYFLPTAWRRDMGSLMKIYSLEDILMYQKPRLEYDKGSEFQTYLPKDQKYHLVHELNDSDSMLGVKFQEHCRWHRRRICATLRTWWYSENLCIP